VKVRINDEDAFGAVRPLDLTAYLRANGWTEVSPGAAVSAWERKTERGRSVEILAPQKQGWRDYARRIEMAIEELSNAEERSALAILRDIGEVSADVVRLRAAGQRDDGTIPLEDGVTLVSSLEKMLLSAACSAVEPRRAFHSRKPGPAVNFAQGLRLGQSERGSYMVSAISHVPPMLVSQQLTIDFSASSADQIVSTNLPLEREAPFARKAILVLAVALGKLEEAAGRGVASGALDSFEDGVTSGISADLCEAVSMLRQCASSSSFRVRIGWAPSRPVDDHARVVSFESDSLEVIQEAGRMLREKEPVPEFALKGIVVDLSRPGDARAGDAQTAATVDGQSRKVVVHVEGDDWDVANDAMSERWPIECTGELNREGRPFRLVNPRHLRRVAQTDW
jgi:hypothetical protein